MKPNELMIGDWVEYGQYITTVRTLSDKIVLSGCIGRLDEVRPVPITTEILEANGFLPANKFNSIWRKDFEEVNYRIRIEFLSNGRMQILVAENTTNLNYLSVRSNSIHSIQQALRLAGLTDQADNIVIKKGGSQ